MSTLLEQLQEFGFNGKKALLYSTLLRTRAGSAAELAREAGIKRTTVYDLLEELVGEGLAVVSFSGRKRVYTASQPSNLELQLQRKRGLLDDLLPRLNVLFNHTSPQPKVRLYDGPKGVRQYHDELLQTRSGDYHYFGSMDGLSSVLGRRYLRSFVRRRVEKKIWAYGIRIREQEIDEPLLLPSEENYRQVRYISLPANERFGSMTLFDDKVAIVASAGENYVLMIESHELFTLLKVIWNYLWESAEK